jgi:hypothetical protein
MMHRINFTRRHVNRMNESLKDHACLRSSTWLLVSLMILTGVSGCQKRCQSMDLGVVKLGMTYAYTPGPVELLEESVYRRLSGVLAPNLEASGSLIRTPQGT